METIISWFPMNSRNETESGYTTETISYYCRTQLLEKVAISFSFSVFSGAKQLQYNFNQAF